MIARLLTLAVVPALLVAPARADAAAPTPTCQGVPATIIGTAADEEIVGTPHRDVIVGLGGDDVLRGRGGSDLLCGGPGDDRLYGGADRRWHDQFQTIGTGDRLDGGAGDDLLNPGPTIKGVELVEPDLLVFASADGVTVDLGAATATGQGHDQIVWRKTLGVVGSPGDDHLIGTDAPDRLVGRGGKDVLTGHGGADTLIADDGDDVVRGGDGADDITSNAGRDEIHGDGADDVISVRGGGADQVDAGNGGDLVFLWLRPGFASLDGAVIDGGAPGAQPWDANNVYFSSRHPVPGSHFTIDGLAGTVDAGDSAGSLLGFGSLTFSISGARLHYLGSDGPDEVSVEGRVRLNADGRGGDDVMYGGPRNDHLVGGPGHDYVNGSTGTDVCDAERERACES